MSSVLVNDRFAGHDFSADACTDGRWGGGANSWSFCHNDHAERNAWLSVQLARAEVVVSVVLYGRSDCCQEHLGTYEVWVGDAPGDPTAAAGMSQCQAGETLIAQATVGPFNVACGLRGTYVTLLLPGPSRQLMLDELVVLGPSVDVGSILSIASPPLPSSPTFSPSMRLQPSRSQQAHQQSIIHAAAASKLTGAGVASGAAHTIHIKLYLFLAAFLMLPLAIYFYSCSIVNEVSILSRLRRVRRSYQGFRGLEVLPDWKPPVDI